MIISTAAILSALGFGTWILGAVFGYDEVAAIGGVIVFGIGMMVTTQGLEVQTGEVETDNNGTVETEYQYSEVELPTSLSLGVLLMLVGGVVLLRSLNSLGTGGFP